MISRYELMRESVGFASPLAAAYVGLSLAEFEAKIVSGSIRGEQSCVDGRVVWTRKSLDPYVPKTPVVYFVGCHDYVKIGVTCDLRRRVAGLQIGAALPLIVHFSCSAGRTEEAELHLRFAKHRVRPDGEWFRFADEIHAWIEEKRNSDHAAIPPANLSLPSPAVRPGHVAGGARG